MPLNNPLANANNAAEYQVSGLPYVTSSYDGELLADLTPVKVSFPSVTQWVTVVNTGAAALHFGFTSKGVNYPPGAVPLTGHGNRITLSPSGAHPCNPNNRADNMRVRVKDIWLRAAGGTATDFQIIAGLTHVSSGSFPTLTGSDGIEGIG